MVGKSIKKKSWQEKAVGPALNFLPEKKNRGNNSEEVTDAMRLRLSKTTAYKKREYFPAWFIEW